MNITIICIGKLKEQYWRDAISEYSKRLGSYCKLNVTELKEAKLPDKAAKPEENAVKKAEGQAILGQIKETDYVVTLEINGKSLSSEGLAEKINELGIEGKSNVTFVIGGSLGLDSAVSQRSDFKLSFSDMTFPHQMMRVILLEQIYRSFKIIRKEAYHK